MSLRAIVMQEKIQQINDNLRFLEENFKAPVHDNEDFDWVVDNIRYCEAQDKIVLKFKPWEGEE